MDEQDYKKVIRLLRLMTSKVIDIKNQIDSGLAIDSILNLEEQVEELITANYVYGK